MPWYIRQLPIQDMLEGGPRVPCCGGSVEGATGQSHLHRYPQPQFRSLPTPPASPSPLRRASLLWEVTRLLWARPRCGLAWHKGPGLQQDQPPIGWLWQPVLWAWAQRAPADPSWAMPLSLPLVLLCVVWWVQGHRMGQCVQVRVSLTLGLGKGTVWEGHLFSLLLRFLSRVNLDPLNMSTWKQLWGWGWSSGVCDVQPYPHS
jgi:hypothetical protein